LNTGIFGTQLIKKRDTKTNTPSNRICYAIKKSAFIKVKAVPERSDDVPDKRELTFVGDKLTGDKLTIYLDDRTGIVLIERDRAAAGADKNRQVP